MKLDGKCEVWDAVGELAELIDADPGSLSTLQHTASAASAKADVCQSWEPQKFMSSTVKEVP